MSALDAVTPGGATWDPDLGRGLAALSPDRDIDVVELRMWAMTQAVLLACAKPEWVSADRTLSHIADDLILYATTGDPEAPADG
jgi:hypothetical protein